MVHRSCFYVLLHPRSETFSSLQRVSSVFFSLSTSGDRVRVSRSSTSVPRIRLNVDRKNLHRSNSLKNFSGEVARYGGKREDSWGKSRRVDREKKKKDIFFSLFVNSRIETDSYKGSILTSVTIIST